MPLMGGIVLALVVHENLARGGETNLSQNALERVIRPYDSRAIMAPLSAILAQTGSGRVARKRRWCGRIPVSRRIATLTSAIQGAT